MNYERCNFLSISLLFLDWNFQNLFKYGNESRRFLRRSSKGVDRTKWEGCLKRNGSGMFWKDFAVGNNYYAIEKHDNGFTHSFHHKSFKTFKSGYWFLYGRNMWKQHNKVCFGNSSTLFFSEISGISCWKLVIYLGILGKLR